MCMLHVHTTSLHWKITSLALLPQPSSCCSLRNAPAVLLPALCLAALSLRPWGAPAPASLRVPGEGAGRSWAREEGLELQAWVCCVGSF